MYERTRWAALAVTVLLMMAASTAWSQWTATIERPSKDPKKPGQTFGWIPDGCKTVRGVFIAQPTMFEAGITKNEEVRAACAEKGIAIVYAASGIGLEFINGPGSQNMLEILAAMAKATNHPELEYAPLITLGHSTGGIYCRNVAYWQPDRVAGVIHVMSGNQQAHIEDYSRSLAGIPILFVNGEWEQYGPDGGDLASGLRSNMGIRMQGNQRQSQTQWLCMRQQIIARRTKNQNNVMGLVVSRDHSHTQWEDAMNGMVAQFIRSVADLRIPKGTPNGKTVVNCLPVTAAQGWLLDADIKAPKYQPAPYKEYKGDPRYTFWFPDKAMAMKVWEYNQLGWKDPDPTANWPLEKRYTPEERLQDIVDIPAPQQLNWLGGSGVWDTNTLAWAASNAAKLYIPLKQTWPGLTDHRRTPAFKAVKWDPQAQAIFNGAGGTITATDKVACSGLTLGKGYTLAIGTNAVDSRLFIILEPGSTLEVTLTPDESNGRWGARMWAAGYAKLGGTLVLKGDNLQEGTYNIIRASGTTSGAFEKVICPDGWTAEGTGGSIKLKKVTK